MVKEEGLSCAVSCRHACQRDRRRRQRAPRRTFSRMLLSIGPGAELPESELEAILDAGWATRSRGSGQRWSALRAAASLMRTCLPADGVLSLRRTAVEPHCASWRTPSCQWTRFMPEAGGRSQRAAEISSRSRVRTVSLYLLLSHFAPDHRRPCARPRHDHPARFASTQAPRVGLRCDEEGGVGVDGQSPGRIAPFEASNPELTSLGSLQPPSYFSRVLRHSKVVGRSDPENIDQVYTAPPSFRARNDYGLKRRLPPQVSPKTPLIALQEIDTRYGQTGYRGAAKESNFVRMWRETELGVTSAPKGHGWLERPVPPIRLESSHFDEGSRESAFTSGRLSTEGSIRERLPAPKIDGMDRESFEGVLKLLSRPDVKALFRRFLAAGNRDTDRRKRDTPAYAPPQEGWDVSAALDPAASEQAEDPNIYEFAQQDPLRIRRVIEAFFRYLSSTQYRTPSSSIDPSPHPNLALAYGHPDDLHSERLTPPFPGRVLDQADRMNARQSVSFAGVVAHLERSGDFDLGTTSYEPDERGHRSLAQGKGDFRVDAPLQRPSIDPFQLPRRDDFQGFEDRETGAPISYQDPRNRPTAMDAGRLRVHVREAARADQSRPNPYKIGSIEWVGTPEQEAVGTLGSELLGILTRDGGQDFSFGGAARGGAPKTPPRSGLGARRRGWSTSKEDSGADLMRVLRDLGAGSSDDRE